MRSSRSRAAAALSLFLPLLLPTGRAHAQKADEAAFQALWSGTASPHAQAAQEAAAFAQRYPGTPLAAIADGLRAWHLLEAGQAAEARQVLERMLAGAEPNAAEMARHWLTRMDRDLVVAALRKAYARDIEFPEALTSAVLAGVPATDRWGEAWFYTATSLKTLQTGERQDFALESKHLGSGSDLAAALAHPYGAGLTWHPVKVLPPIGGKTVITFQDAAGKTNTLSESAAGAGLGFPYLGESILIISNGDYWSVQPRPAGE